jgi:hypothetical protein
MSAARPNPRFLVLALLVSCLPAGLGASVACAQDRDADLAARTAEMDRQYAFGPSPAREINYRISWQSSINGKIKRLDVFGDDVFAMSTRNQLTRFDRNSGSRIWSVTGADELDTIWGVTPGVAPPGGRPFGQNDDDKIYITSDPCVFELDYNSGAVVGRQDLERIPSTEVLPFGNHLVFGTRSGQIVWHQFVVGQAWRANQLKGPVVADPTLVGTRNIACASEGGTLLLLDGKSARKLWGDNLFDGVKAAVTSGGGKIFAASTDQYLWAFDARTGGVSWRYFTESPLVDSPVYIDDDGGRVMQWVETEGLVCLEANPKNSIEGRTVWTIEGARGQAIGMIHGDVAIWDGDAHTLRLINASQGAITKTLQLPQVDHLSMNGDSIFAVAADGRVVRLDPIK